jgi:hypothetical protein
MLGKPAVIDRSLSTGYRYFWLKPVNTPIKATPRDRMYKRLFIAVAAVACSVAQAAEFTIVTTKGYVSFAVPDDWRVIAMQSKSPVAVAAFQIPNPADSGTPDATNVAVSLFSVETKPGRDGERDVGRQFGPTAPTVTAKDGWTVYTQTANQGDTLYTIIDAKKSCADVVVGVRFAWPHLPKNAPELDTQMKGQLDSVLDSVNGALGRPQRKDGDVVRRPVK